MHPLTRALDFIAPTPCQACDRLDSRGWLGLLCLDCSATLPTTVRRVTGPVSVAETVSMGPYEGALGSIVRAAKYGPNLSAADALGRRLGRALHGWVDVDAVVAVPIPAWRRWRRGSVRVSVLPAGWPRQLGSQRCHCSEGLRAPLRSVSAPLHGAGSPCRPSWFGRSTCPSACCWSMMFEPQGRHFMRLLVP